MKRNNLIKLHVIKYLGDLECLMVQSQNALNYDVTHNLNLIHNLVKNIENLTYLNYKNLSSIKVYTDYRNLTVYINSSNQTLNLYWINFNNLILDKVNFNEISAIYTGELNTRTKLNNLVTIGSDFLIINKLKLINLYFLNNVTSIGNNFLSSNQLKTIDLSPLVNVISIGSHFLYNNLITSIDLLSLIKLSVVDKKFLYKNCISKFELTRIKSLNTKIIFK